jgi:hypothetical protein
MKNDKPTQTKLKKTAKHIVKKMNYDPNPWKTLFKKMDEKNPEIFYQIPQIIYEAVEKKLKKTLPKKQHQFLLQSYINDLNNIYDYNRWKGNQVTCWIASEIIKLCVTDAEIKQYYITCFNYDPMIENLQTDILTGKKRNLDSQETYIQWELRLADHYLAELRAFAAVQAAYNALASKLGLHAIWPPTKVIEFDIATVQTVTQLINDPELFRLYDIATDLDAVDDQKAHWYAKHFIKKVKELIPHLISIEQDQAKYAAYIT